MGTRGYSFVNRLLIFKDKDSLSTTIQHVVLPQSRRKTAIYLVHGAIRSGHFGRDKTHSMLKQNLTWPGGDKLKNMLKFVLAVY